MRNAIRYYYNLDVEQLENDSGNFLFDDYILKQVRTNIDLGLYDFLLSIGVNLNKIIYNIKGELITNINDKRYILMQNYKLESINLNLIDNFFIELNTSKKHDWAELWENKVDYFEKNIFSYNDKNKEAVICYPYYIGLSEIAIKMYKELSGEGTCCVCHNRLKSDSDFYSIDNIIIDYKVRDIAEYIKNSFFNESLNYDEVFDYLAKTKLLPIDFQLLFIRLIFPSFFFDCIENNENLDKYSSKIDEYELMLNKFYYFIKTRVHIPKIDWLIKN